MTVDFLGAQSLYLGIAGFLLTSGNRTMLRFSKALVTLNNRPVVKLCGARTAQLSVDQYRFLNSKPFRSTYV